MGCAGSNPLPAGDTMTTASTNGHATVMADAPPTVDADKPCTMVQKVVGNVNIDEIVKSIKDVTGSMENLMDETQEKLCSLIGKTEEKAENAKEAVEDKINNVVTSAVPEKPKIEEVIVLAFEEIKEIKVMPIIDELKSKILNDKNGSAVEELAFDTEQKIKPEDAQVEETEETEKQNTEKKEEEAENKEEEMIEGEKIEEEKHLEENGEEEKVANEEEEKAEEEKTEEEKTEEEKTEEEKTEKEKTEEEKTEEEKAEEEKTEEEKAEEE